MRRLRNDLPYTFRPPIWRSWFRPIGLWANRRILDRKYRISKLEEEGFELIHELVERGDAVILAPNHADHADPHVMLEMGGRCRLPLHFMAAREVFEISDRAAWALQSMGVFSVDRDGPDMSAIKTAMNLLQNGKPLVMYPEGEIYHHHERLDPLHEGVASILLKVASKLPEGKRAWLVPVGMRFRHDPSVEATFPERLSRLEDRIGWTPKPSMSVNDRILRLGSGILSLKETEFLGEAGSGPLQDRLTTLCEKLLEEVEGKHGSDPRATTPPERVRAQRYRIRKRLLDEKEPPSEQQRMELFDDLDRVFAALQAHSYIGDYLLENPTLDRHGETVMKLEEDLFDFPEYPTTRIAHVIAGEPLNVSQMLAEGELPAKGGAGVLTATLEERLNQILAKI
ncbi:lysophospholipid acyltransferase family protein [Haloferula sp.]|uniref:lysophospholipid acyltransferase family protein n=1 Tax=Haloferula sp. TaxID=2497595 RepID=UPI0032A05B90